MRWIAPCGPVSSQGAGVKDEGQRKQMHSSCVPFLSGLHTYAWPGQTLVKLAPLPASTSEPVISPCDSLALPLGPPSLAQSSGAPSKELPKTHSVSPPPLLATRELSSLD